MKPTLTAARAAAGYAVLTILMLAAILMLREKSGLWEYLIYENVPYYENDTGSGIRATLLSDTL